METDNQVKCPKCGSTSLTANRKGFGLGKAVVGGVLLGGVGLLGGFLGSRDVQITCLNCGEVFKPGDKPHKPQTFEEWNGGTLKQSMWAIYLAIIMFVVIPLILLIIGPIANGGSGDSLNRTVIQGPYRKDTPITTIKQAKSNECVSCYKDVTNKSYYYVDNGKQCPECHRKIIQTQLDDIQAEIREDIKKQNAELKQKQEQERMIKLVEEMEE